MRFLYFSSILWCVLIFGCRDSEHNLIPNSANTQTLDTLENRTLSKEFKTYWYSGKAEISTYSLAQERYGELRNGTAVNIFVTEDFLPDAQVKANTASDETVSVLKLNQTKKYITGIYPYSVMTSTFSPLEQKNAALKISHSMQEWCGHAYVQLNTRNQFDIVQHSYFAGEADMETTLPITHLESDLWNIIRINPSELPSGTFSMLPSFEYFRMSHNKIKAHTAEATLKQTDSITTYTIQYPELKRSLAISYSSQFPYHILSWQESHANGLVTKAEKIKEIKTAYWLQNSTSFEYLRDSLGL